MLVLWTILRTSCLCFCILFILLCPLGFSMNFELWHGYIRMSRDLVLRACAAAARGSGFSQKLYACALLIGGLGHATWSLTMPVSRSRTTSFYRNRHISFRALVALEPLVSLMSRFGACSARISGDRHTQHTDRQTERHTERLQ